MFFRNLSVYRIPAKSDIYFDAMSGALESAQLFPCGHLEAESIGWVSPCDNGTIVHVTNRQILISLGVQEKILPAAVVRKTAGERAKAIEEAEGRRVGRKELRDLREALTVELLPKALVRERRTFAWLDSENGWLAIDSGAQSKAEELLEHLRKTVDGFPASLLKTAVSPSSAMTGWVAGNEAPSGFTIDHDIELRSAENATIRYQRHSLEGKEIREHIAEGKVVTRLGLTWNDRISFVLDEKLQIKRLSFLDILKEQNDGQAENDQERFDLDFAMMTGELSRMLDDVVFALGGEPEKA